MQNSILHNITNEFLKQDKELFHPKPYKTNNLIFLRYFITQYKWINRRIKLLSKWINLRTNI